MSALQKGASRIARCGGYGSAFAGVPLPSFLLRSPDGAKRNPGRAVQAAMSFPDCASLHPGYETGHGRKKVRPHPCPFRGPDRFRARRDHNFASTRSLRGRAPKNSRAEMRRENAGACHESTAKLAQRAPSPQRGEGWGEGVRTLEQILGLPNPLILSFSPLGRRDAAYRPRQFSAGAPTITPSPRAPPGPRYATTPKSCRGTPCRNRAPCAPCRSWRQARRARHLPSLAPP